MKRRHFIEAGAAIVGIAWFSHHLSGGSQDMANVDKAQKHQFEVTKTDAEWREILKPEQFRVLRQHGTERAGTSPLDKEYGEGTYYCAGCELPLFTSNTKYNSGTGWPSFYAPIEGSVETSIDRSLFMTRVEVHCRRCGGHLGHVFDDGPAPTGKRYCMNGVSLKFDPA
jgi:peptide-methionine (R)-S-oxide reductase